jgi:dienelactone hydrolase
MSSIDCIPVSCFEAIPESSANNLKGQVILIPTAAGLYRPLDKAYPNMARALAESGYLVRVVEFPGQNGRAGKYSVFASCLGLANFLEQKSLLEGIPLFLFGVCTGALAALFSAVRTRTIKAIFTWDLCPTYQYSPEAYRRLEQKFGLMVHWDTALTPVQAEEIVGKVQQRVYFGVPIKSKCTNVAEQQGLCKLAKNSKCIPVEGVGHIPGLPRDSEMRIAQIICKEYDVVMGES